MVQKTLLHAMEDKQKLLIYMTRYRKWCECSRIMSPLGHCWQVQQRKPSLYKQVTCQIQYCFQGTLQGSSLQQWWNCERNRNKRQVSNENYRLNSSSITIFVSHFTNVILVEHTCLVYVLITCYMEEGSQHQLELMQSKYSCIYQLGVKDD